jgi:hypothetical protein
MIVPWVLFVFGRHWKEWQRRSNPTLFSDTRRAGLHPPSLVELRRTSRFPRNDGVDFWEAVFAANFELPLLRARQKPIAQCSAVIASPVFASPLRATFPANDRSKSAAE